MNKILVQLRRWIKAIEEPALRLVVIRAAAEIERLEKENAKLNQCVEELDVKCEQLRLRLAIKVERQGSR